MTGAICALALITASPPRATADVIVFGADGSARISGWVFHGERPTWAGFDRSTGTAHAPRTPKKTPQPEDVTSPPSRVGILKLIRETSARHQHDHALARAALNAKGWHILFQAMIEAESSYNPTAVSPKGAYGLGQLMPQTARSLGVDPRDVAQNLDGAARYLLAQLSTFQNIDLALAAYNAGPHRVVEYSAVPPFAETRDYIARIHRIRNRLTGPPVSQPSVHLANRRPERAPVHIDLN